MTQDLDYTAYFEPRTLHVRAGSLSVFPTLSSSGVSSSRPGHEVFEGQRVGFYFEMYAPQGYYVFDASTDTYRQFGTTCTLYAGEGTDGAVLATYSRNSQSLVVNSNLQRCLTADPLPAGLTKATIALQIEDGPVWTETFDVTALQAGSAPLRYQDVPGSGLEYGTAADLGPAVYDAAAYVDETTGAATVYLATNGGVAMSEGGAYTIMPGLSSGVVAVGGESRDALYAIGVEKKNITPPGADYPSEYARHYVYQLTNGSWSKIDETGHDILSAVGVLNDTASYIGLVMNGSSIWLQDAHWNGAEWVDNEVEFNSFWKVDAETAYAGSANGLYRYQGGEWTQVTGTSGSMFITGGCRTASGVKLTVAAGYDVRGRVRGANCVSYPKLAEISGESVTVSEIDVSSVAEGSDNNSKYVGLASDGTLYLLNAGRLYANQSSEQYIGSNVYKYVNDTWQYQIVEEFNDPLYEDDDPDTKYRPDNVRYMVSPCDGVTFFLGDDGAIYLLTEDTTITFDAQGGVFRNEALATLTAPILSEISSSLVPTVTKEDKSFGGWYYDAEGTAAWTPGYMPAKSITLYAKWNEKDVDAELQQYKDQALASLDQQFSKYSRSDYSDANWADLEAAYQAGIAAINAAEPGTEHIEDNVMAALNAALEAMQAIPADNAGKIEVAVSMDANTLGLGYLIKPTLVKVDKYEQASVVFTELIEEMAAEKYGVTSEGLTAYHDFEPEGDYPWVITGTPEHDFYLAQVYYPEQEGYQIPGGLQDYIDRNNIDIDPDGTDVNGRYLGEFDYTNNAGWMYSVGDKTEGGASFPGVGASGWSLTDGEVVRYQFTLVGYGADLGANNTEWGASAIINAAEKSALTWEVATLRSQYSDATLEANEVYANALAVLTDAEASQEAVDAALAALKNETFAAEPSVTVANDSESSSVTIGEKTMSVAPNGAATVTAAVGEGDIVTVTVQTNKTVQGAQVESTLITLTGTAAYTDGSNVFTVESTGDIPCVILVKNGESYEALPVDTAGGVHTVTLAADAEIVVAVKGDTNGDGQLDIVDTVAVKAADLGRTTPDALQKALMDLNGDGVIDLSDTVAMKAAELDKVPMAW